MNRKWWERPACFLCDHWWALLLAFALVLAAYFTRGYWLPLLGVTTPTPTPTATPAPTGQPISNTAAPSAVTQTALPTSSAAESIQQSGYINTQGGYGLNYPIQWQGTEIGPDIQFFTQQGAMVYVHVEPSVKDVNTLIEMTQPFPYDMLQIINTNIAGQPARCIETALPGNSLPTASSCFFLKGQKGFVISLAELGGLNQDQLQSIRSQFTDLLSSFRFVTR